jgi:hypothetical protein
MINLRGIVFCMIILLILTGCDNRSKMDEKHAFTDEEHASLLQISPAHLNVGEETMVTITLKAPENGIAAGGGLRFPFYMKPWNGLIKGVSADKRSNSLVSVSRSDGGKVEATNILTNPQWDILSDLKIILQDTPLPEGESLIITFGSDQQKVVVGRKQLSFFLEVEIDTKGDGTYKKLIPPSLPVVESKPARLYLVAPSFATPGEHFEVTIYAEDDFQNVCEYYQDRVEISISGEEGVEPFSYQMRKWDHNKDLDRNGFDYAIHQEGIYYLKAITQDGELTTLSNPIIVSEKSLEKNIFWGEVHVHSQLSDGRGELQDIYRDGYARGLDFLAITDHGFGRNDRGTLAERIGEICREADRFNKPGKFVTIPAGETHYLPVMHMNMYFDESNPDKMLSLVNSIDNITKDLRKNWNDLSSEELTQGVVPYWDVFKSEIYNEHTLVFPHHTMWLGIKPFLDAEHTRVIEVYSVHGTSEIRNQKNTPNALQMKPDRMEGDPSQKFSAREILNDGMRLGFVGGSDSHEGQAGYNAITGVYANALNRRAIIKGIYDKECYATSSNRTLIIIEKKENGFECTVAGDGILDDVEVIQNGDVAFKPDNISGRICKFEWTPPEPWDGYFYVKAILEERHEAAWSSPVWLD